MVAPSASTSGDSTPAPVAFSYAQAAKGNPPSGSLSQLSVNAKEPGQPSKDGSDAHTAAGAGEKSQWAEDAATVVDDHETLINGTSHKNENNAGLMKNGESQSSTPNYEGSSVSTAHDDSAPAASATTEQSWERKSASSSAHDAQTPNDGPKSRRGSTKEQRAAEKPAAESMKEAPIPTVNIWAQRAQDAKVKHPMAPPPKPVTTSQPTAFATNAPPSTPTSAARSSSEGQIKSATNSGKLGFSGRNADGRGSLSAGSDKTAKPAQPPTVNDSAAWPTPLIAQSASEAEKKKALDQTDKGETADRPTPKPHGKNEWVSIPFTPSVKFETPMPNQGRRGGRPGGRGGRGGATPTDRPSRNGFGSEAVEGQERGRGEEAGDSRSSSLPAKSKRPSSDIPSARPSPGEDAKPPYKTENATRRPSFGGETKSRSPVQVAPKPDASQVQSQDTRAGAESTSPVETRSRRQEPSPADAGHGSSESTGKTQQRWKAARGLEGSSGSPTESEDRRRDDNAHSTGKPGSAGRRGEGSRQADAGREGSPPHRGGRESRRGRGGRGGNLFTPHVNTNGHPSAGPPPPHSAKATSSFTSQYAQQYAPFLQNTRGNSFRSNGPRSASIPSGYAPGFGYPGQFEYDMSSVYAMGMASPGQQYQPPNPSEMLSNGVSLQINYYFSLDNLLKDMFLRSNMDSQGFVPLSLIAEFKRLKVLCGDINVIRNACLSSHGLEVRTTSEGKDYVRVREGWDKWVLPVEERQDSARHDGPPAPADRAPAARTPLSPNHLNWGPDGFYPQPPYSAIPTGYPPMNFAGYSASGKNPSNRHSVAGISSEHHNPAPFYTQNGAAAVGPNEETDAFPDASIGHLTVVVRPVGTESFPKPLDAASRTFSNGSLDASSTTENAESDQSGDASDERNEKIEELRRTLTKQSPHKKTTDVALYWIKEKETPESMPQGTATEPYLQLHEKALQQRGAAGPGETPHDMDVLYQFWSHFLIRNYNGCMYSEFRKLAHEDMSINSTLVGMHNLIKYYGASLSSPQPIRATVLGHYIELVKNEDPGKDRLAFKQLRKAWRDGSTDFRNRKRLHDALDSDLKAELER